MVGEEVEGLVRERTRRRGVGGPRPRGTGTGLGNLDARRSERATQRAKCVGDGRRRRQHDLGGSGQQTGSKLGGNVGHAQAVEKSGVGDSVGDELGEGGHQQQGVGLLRVQRGGVGRGGRGLGDAPSILASAFTQMLARQNQSCPHPIGRALVGAFHHVFGDSSREIEELAGPTITDRCDGQSPRRLGGLLDESWITEVEGLDITAPTLEESDHRRPQFGVLSLGEFGHAVRVQRVDELHRSDVAAIDQHRGLGGGHTVARFLRRHSDALGDHDEVVDGADASQK